MIRYLNLLLLLVVASSNVYTNQQALSCFNSNAFPTCQPIFDDCFQNEECSNELQLYNRCSFGDNSEQSKNVFNGYCFRRWEQKAQLTKNLIVCMSNACNFTYNSEIGIQQLFNCIQWVMLESQVECGESCEKEMQSKIKSNFYKMTFLDLYQQDFQDKDLQQFTQMVVKECIHNGAAKAMIYQEQMLAQEERLSAKYKENDEEAKRIQLSQNEL